MKVGFIGAGKVGCSFGAYITHVAENQTQNLGGITVTLAGYYSRTRESAAYAAQLTQSRTFLSAAELIAGSDVVFLTVPDAAVAETWEHICELPETKNKLFCHMSGALSSRVFDAADSSDASGRAFASLHPMLAIADKERSWQKFADAYFTFDGNDEADARIRPLITALGLRTERIAADAKILYHAACVFASNLVCALAYDAEALLKECGLSEEFSSAAWRTLFHGNAENVAFAGPVTALTGPAERGDTATIEAHKRALAKQENLLEAYNALTNTLLQMASLKSKK